MKEKSNEEFYRFATKCFGWYLAFLGSSAIAWKLLSGSLTLPIFLFSFFLFMSGMYLRRVANREYNGF